MVLQAGVTVVAGVLFGLALAAPPGPMNAIIAEESVVQGWVAGFKTGLGAMTADVVFFLLALGGVVAVVERFPGLRHGMITVGGLLMLYFALGAVRSVRATLAPDRSTGTSRGFRKAFLLALTNPYQILFWLTVGVGLLDPGRVDVLEPLPVIGDMTRGLLVVETGSVALVGGLFAGIVLWIVGFPAVLVAARERVELLAPLVALLSAVVLAASGVFFLFEGITGLFPV